MLYSLDRLRGGFGHQRAVSVDLLAQLGCINEVAEAIVGHMPKDIVATYNTHTYDAERLEWLAKLDRHLEGLAAQ